MTDSPGPRSRFWLYSLICVVVRAVARLAWRLDVRGLEHVPLGGGLLVVANHQSYLDPPLIGAALDPVRQVHFVARAGLFRNPLFARLITTLKAFPIEEGGRADVAAMRTIIQHLDRGDAVLLFPEGSRSPDGAMHEFKRGTEVLLRRSRAGVLPVAIEGAFDVLPRDRSRPRVLGERVAVTIGRPVTHDEIERDGSGPTLARLASEIDAMRLEARARMRAATGGRRPRPGPGDAPRAPVDVS